jgi:4-oxalocrotonate tautomerase
MRGLPDAPSGPRPQRCFPRRRDSPGDEDEETQMPFIDVKVMENVLSEQEKRALAERITDAFTSVVGEAARPVTWVVIQDVASGQWTMGGQAVTTEGVREMLARTPATV